MRQTDFLITVHVEVKYKHNKYKSTNKVGYIHNTSGLTYIFSLGVTLPINFDHLYHRCNVQKQLVTSYFNVHVVGSTMMKRGQR